MLRAYCSSFVPFFRDIKVLDLVDENTDGALGNVVDDSGLSVVNFVGQTVDCPRWPGQIHMPFLHHCVEKRVNLRVDTFPFPNQRVFSSQPSWYKIWFWPQAENR